MSDAIPMTVFGKAQLEKELEQLIKVEREEIKRAISEARAHGDLKENSEYHAAKEKQSHIEGRIMDVQSKLSRATVVDVSKLKNSNIVFGATVRLLDVEKDNVLTYQIVGDDEADLKQGKISFASPLGRSLIGKEVGDTVTVNAPKGDFDYEVEHLEYK